MWLEEPHSRRRSRAIPSEHFAAEREAVSLVSATILQWAYCCVDTAFWEYYLDLAVG
jgi:hypothetical protein